MHYSVRTGSIEVIAGVMFSGKSEELIRRVRRALIARKQVQVFKSHLDERFGGVTRVSSHDGTSSVTAQLLVDADQAGWAEGHVGRGAVVERRDDGAVVLSVRVTNRDALRSFVLGFLDHAELLGPPELRADLVSWLEALCPA